jgi:hypothetical protein
MIIIMTTSRSLMLFNFRERKITKEEYEANLNVLQAYNPRDHRGIVTLSNRKQALVSINQQKKTI